MLLDIVLVLIGFFLLLKGGGYLVEGAVSVARAAKLSPMVIGITIVGFGTSSPELLVSVAAALKHSPGIAIGNVVGSNIANIGMILGVVALICRIPVKKSSLHIDLPFMLLSVSLLAIAGSMGTIHRWEGFLAVLLLAGYCMWQVRNSRHHPDPSAEDSLSEFPQHRTWVALLLIVGSCLALSYGADLLIEGASGLAMGIGQAVGVPHFVMERIVGLTVVAVGTSLPELFASVVAARKGQTDMALGNIIGSVTFNVLSVLGIAAAICPIHHTDVGFAFDYLTMVVLSLLLFFFARLHHALVRWEGAILLAAYIAYIARTFTL